MRFITDDVLPVVVGEGLAATVLCRDFYRRYRICCILWRNAPVPGRSFWAEVNAEVRAMPLCLWVQGLRDLARSSERRCLLIPADRAGALFCREAREQLADLMLFADAGPFPFPPMGDIHRHTALAVGFCDGEQMTALAIGRVLAAEKGDPLAISPRWDAALAKECAQTLRGSGYRGCFTACSTERGICGLPYAVEGGALFTVSAAELLVRHRVIYDPPPPGAAGAVWGVAALPLKDARLSPTGRYMLRALRRARRLR